MLPAEATEQTPSPPPSQRERGTGEGRWDFNTPELASAYADWLKARADVPFYEKQLEDIRKLAAETLKAKKDVRDRLEKLVKAGTDPEKDLAAAKADYLQAKAQSQKDEHEAQTNVNNAKRTLATLERQLFQAGIDPELLANATESTAIVVAEVPEARIGLVEKGQACTARFYAFPGESFPGSVRSLAPTISKERRTLRVFFQLSDPQGRLKPGMFAEIGLGTDARKTLRIPADGVLHVGQSDYVLVASKGGDWKITEIKTGEQYGNRIEVLEGLQPGDRVIGAGAILLKPYVVQDIQAVAEPRRRAATTSGGSGRDAAGTHAETAVSSCTGSFPAETGNLYRGAPADDSHADTPGLSQRWLVLMLAGMFVALGVWAFQHQQIDAYPDISGQMVQIITTYPGRARRKWNAR